MNRELEHWFVSEILPHEAALMRYLKRVWKSPSELSDLRQETYVRVFESAARERPRSPRTFLFTAARHLMVDKMRRERVVSIGYVQNLDSLGVSMDELTPERRVNARQELQRLTEAFAILPETTRAAIWLRRIAGLSQREAAKSLGIDEGALEGHMTRGLRSLTKTILSDSMYGKRSTAGASNRGTERGHRID